MNNPASDSGKSNVFKPYYGPGYNLTWITGQLLNMLLSLGWKKREGNLINPDTGEILDQTASPRVLIEALLSRSLAPSRREIQRQKYTADMEILGYRKAVATGDHLESMRGAA